MYVLFYFCWLLEIYCPLGARHRVMGCEEGSQVTWIVKSKVSQLPFWCFAVLILKTELPPLAATCLVLGRGREERGWGWLQ